MTISFVHCDNHKKDVYFLKAIIDVRIFCYWLWQVVVRWWENFSFFLFKPFYFIYKNIFEFLNYIINREDFLFKYYSARLKTKQNIYITNVRINITLITAIVWLVIDKNIIWFLGLVALLEQKRSKSLFIREYWH